MLGINGLPSCTCCYCSANTHNEKDTHLPASEQAGIGCKVGQFPRDLARFTGFSVVLACLFHERESAHFISTSGCDCSQSEVSTRCWSTLLKVNPERKRRKPLESKPKGRILHLSGEIFGLGDGCANELRAIA